MDIYQEYLKRAEGLGDTALLALQKELLLPAVMEEKAAFVKAELRQAPADNGRRVQRRGRDARLPSSA